MPAGRLIRLAKPPGEVEFPLYLVAAEGAERATQVLRKARLVNGGEVDDIGPISEKAIHRLGLRPDQFVRVKWGG